MQVAGNLSIDGTSATGIPAALTGIATNTFGTGAAGNVTVTAGNLRVANNGQVASGTFASGDAGSVTVKVAGALSIDGTSKTISTSITSESGFGTGRAGEVRVSADSLSIANGGEISASTFGSGAGGNVVSVTVAGDAVIGGPLGILAQTIFHDFGSGNAGNITVDPGNLSILANGQISSSTFGAGKGGSVSVNVAGLLSIANGGTISASTFRTGAGGSVSVSAGLSS